MSRLENIQRPFKSVWEKIKACLHRQQWKEALIFFAFILLALGFWLLQSLQQEYEIEIEIPVRYKNMPADIAFNTANPEKVVARVKDKGSVLLNYSFGRTFIPIDISMKDTEEKSGKTWVSKKQIESDILKQLIATTTLVDFTPSSIELDFSKRMHKEVQVTFDGTIETIPGFQVSDKIQIKPSYTTVYAATSVLDTLTEVKTTAIQIKKGDKTITRTLKLQKVAGANLVPDAVTVTIPIEEYTEKTLEVPVQCLDVPSHYAVRMFPSIVKVTCNVPLSRFKDLSEEQFEILIHFSELEQNSSGTLPIKLEKKPNWVNTVTLSPDRIEFILEQNKAND